MHSNLYLKFILIYIAFGFLSVFTAATLSLGLSQSSAQQQTSDTLYREANLIASEYLPGYFTENLTYSQVRIQLDGMRTYLESDLWFVDDEGKMLIYSQNSENRFAPSYIQDFDPAEVGSSQYLIGNYHEYFKEDVITVIAPVTQHFTTKGYLLIHKPLSEVTASSRQFMNVIYITLAVVFALSFFILLGFHFLIYRPLRLITEAAKQYASGNLEYEIPVNTQDEMGYLSASLNYMSSHLRDMEDYQKKFIANVSHDFRSPLTSIKGYVEAIADGTIPPNMHAKYLRIISTETDRLTDLTKDLLTLNEYDTQDLMLNKSIFDLHEMVKDTAAAFEGACTNKRISIELLFASKALNVHADKRKIQQVFYNLLDNAIKFSGEDSAITIETTERTEKVSISVKDRGIGIPKNSLNKIWERFYKSDLSRGKDKKGTGLGLAIVKEALQAHGENINVVSTEGVGTEFIFSLPKAKE